MSSYLYELPTTGAISFAEFCHDQSAEYIAELAETTEARANLRAALKEFKRTDDHEKDNLKLVKVLDDYIPRLHGVLACVDSGEVTVRSEPIFSWRTTLSANLFHSSPRISIPSLATDVAFTLLTHAFGLSNLARAVIVSLGSYEIERGLPEADRQAKDERLGFAVTLLCKASGVFEYLAKDVLALWEANRQRVVTAGMSCPRPPDLSREVLIGLSKMAIADAQDLAIRKLLTKAAMESALSPGPPLPKSHPSPALAAKLHLECAALYSSARALVKTPGASRPSLSSPSSKSKSKFRLPLGRDKDKNKNQDQDADAPVTVRDEAGEEVTPELRRYLADEAALHNALAHKWLGVDAGENGTTAQTGTAVGFLTWAKKELEDLKGSGHGGVAGIGTSDREKEMHDARKTRLQKELEGVNVFLKGYKRMNDTMGFQPVPSQADLQASIPAGRLAVTIKPYPKPIPLFGPGSVDYARKQTEALELLSTEDDGNNHGNGSLLDNASSKQSYAGAGSYF